MSPSEAATLRTAVDTVAPFSPANCVAWYPGENQCIPVMAITPDGAAKLRDGYHVTLAREDVALASFALVTRLG